MLKASIYDRVRGGRSENRAQKEELLVRRRSSNKFSNAAFSQVTKVSTSLGDRCSIRKKSPYNLGSS